MKKIKMLIMVALLFATDSVINAQTTGTPGLSYTLINNGTEYSVARGTADAANVVIPATYNGRPVTEIASAINYGEHIIDGSFANYYEMTSITIPNSIKKIGEYAFFSTSLFNITIPDSVTSIGNNAFEFSNLRIITISKSVTSIGSGVFGFCSSLTNIIVDANNPNYSSQNGALYNKEKTQLIKVPEVISGNFTIPNSVISIDDSAFYRCRNITSITIPEGTTNIGNFAFNECSKLTSITIPNSVVKIGQWVFSDCESLTNAVLGSGLTYIGICMFTKCKNLMSITIPNGVTSIGVQAFSATGLRSITIPDSVKIIEDWAFYCDNLVSVTLGSIAQNNFYENAFNGNLRTVYFNTGSGAGTYTRAIRSDNWVKRSDNPLNDLLGVWEGTYTAGQGQTGLTLIIFQEENNYKAIFEFYSVQGSRNAASGSYYMNVSYDQSTGMYTLTGYEWINQPSGYGFANLEGSLTGDVFSGSTFNFKVVRK